MGGNLRTLTLLVSVSLLSCEKINERTVVNVDEMRRPFDVGTCECTRDAATLSKGEEHLRLLLRVSSVRLISTLQNLAHQANAEINFLVQRSKYKLYEGMKNEFPRLMSQSSIGDSIEELIHKLRNQLFISTDLSPQRIEKEMEKAVQNFFMQILPPTFLCMTTGPCRSVTQSYANCLRNNSPSWKTFYGTEPKEMAAKLRTAILKYRIIEKTIDKLHRSVVEIEAINITCIARFTAVVYCGLECSKLEGSGSPVGYCSDACTNAVRNCLGESATDWDSFVTILRKLSIDFDNGFSELERGVIASVSHAVEVEAPAIAKVVLKKCGPASASKSTLSNRTLEYNKPIAVQRKLVGMIRKFTSYVGWWQRLSQNVCSDASRMSTCWNGTALISSAEINAQPQSAVKPKLAAASPPLRVTTDHSEGSGSPVDWSDDEDINSEGSGSGDGEPPVQPMPAVAQRELITQPPVPSSTPSKPTITERPAIQMQRPTKPPTAISPPPMSKSAHRRSPLSLMMLFLIVLFVHISR